VAVQSCELGLVNDVVRFDLNSQICCYSISERFWLRRGSGTLLNRTS